MRAAENPVRRAPLSPWPEIPGWIWRRLAGVEVLIAGVGSVGSPLADGLLSFGVTRFLICDGKRYKADSVRSQCEEDEVGELKVQVVARRLRRRGARVRVRPTALEAIEPGWLGPDGILVACGDNKGIHRVANRLGLTLRRPVFIVNLEPDYLAASLTYIDFSRSTSVCHECGWGPADYNDQASAVSCDGSAARPSGSPRALGAMTAGWAAMTIARTIAVDGAAERWSGRQMIFSALGPRLMESVLAPNPACLAPHGAPVPERIDETPAQVSFASLAARAGLGGAGVRASGSGRIARRAICSACGARRDGVWWWIDPLRPAGRCPCGRGRLHPMPFFSASSWSREDLGIAWGRPLSELGVGRRAIIAVSSDGKKEGGSYVLS